MTVKNCVVRHDPPRPVAPPSRAFCAECYAKKQAWKQLVSETHWTPDKALLAALRVPTADALHRQAADAIERLLAERDGAA